jgi:hypothetical protein
MGFPDIITFILIIGLIISATILLKFILISMFNIASSDKLMTAILAVIAFLTILADIAGFQLLFMFFTGQI